MGLDDGEGVIMANVESGLMWKPRHPIPKHPWVERLPLLFLVQWLREAAQGRNYTLP